MDRNDDDHDVLLDNDIAVIFEPNDGARQKYEVMLRDLGIDPRDMEDHYKRSSNSPRRGNYDSNSRDSRKGTHRSGDYDSPGFDEYGNRRGKGVDGDEYNGGNNKGNNFADAGKSNERNDSTADFNNGKNRDSSSGRQNNGLDRDNNKINN